MREILFRGKAINRDPNRSYRTKYKNGDWVYGLLTDVENYAGFSEMTNTDGVSGIEVDKNTVGQFTGLTDKNGTKIFEGDVVAQNWYDHDEPADSSFGEVVFCEYDCSFSVMDIEKDGIVPLGICHAYHWEAEVIGNIHDNDLGDFDGN